MGEVGCLLLMRFGLLSSICECRLKDGGKPRNFLGHLHHGGLKDSGKPRETLDPRAVEGLSHGKGQGGTWHCI